MPGRTSARKDKCQEDKCQGGQVTPGQVPWRTSSPNFPTASKKVWHLSSWYLSSWHLSYWHLSTLYIFLDMHFYWINSANTCGMLFTWGVSVCPSGTGLLYNKRDNCNIRRTSTRRTSAREDKCLEDKCQEDKCQGGQVTPGQVPWRTSSPNFSTASKKVWHLSSWYLSS